MEAPEASSGPANPPAVNQAEAVAGGKKETDSTSTPVDASVKVEGDLEDELDEVGLTPILLQPHLHPPSRHSPPSLPSLTVWRLGG